MSGGSFHYLCYAHENGKLEEQRDDLEQMHEWLLEHGYDDIAARTEMVLHLLDMTAEQAAKLSDVWRAVEWFVSNDYGEDQVVEAAESYRISHLGKRVYVRSEKRKARE